MTPSTGTTTFTLSDRTTYTGEPHCGFATVFGGFGIVVIHEEASEPLRVINVFDGFRQFHGSAITLTPTNFRVPSTRSRSPTRGVVGRTATTGSASPTCCPREYCWPSHREVRFPSP